MGRRWPRLLLACPVPVAAGVGGVALAAAYALFAGWGVPAQRTVTMLAVVVGLALTGRRWPWPVTWGLAMAAALLVDPWAWWQPGFWLSFVAVAVLFAQGDGGLPGAGWTGRLRNALREGWRAQLVVTVALAPLTLVFFGQVSVVGLVANAVAIPWVTWALTPVALLGVLWAPLWDVAAGLARGLLTMLHAMAAWPLAVWERPALPVALAVLAAVGAAVLVWPLPWRWRAWGAILLWPAWTFQPPAPAPGTFEVLLPDVGQGSAAIVRTARHTLVFDAGPPLGRGDAAERVLLPWLRALGAQPDAIVISHDDSDHAAGMATLAAAYPHTAWWASFDPGDRVVAPVRTCVAGETWEWDGVRFAFLHPPTADWAPRGRGGDNARSCVLRIGDGPASALLTGDIRAEEEALLIAAGAAQPVGLLVAAHHGSGTSTSAAWLDALQPRAVAIQAGWRNRYGHPHPQVLRRLDQRGIAWVNTATCGATTWHSAQPRKLRCERRERRRYVDTGAPLPAGAAAGVAAGRVAAGDGELW
ncbi:ComE operon protein 3 [Tepidimonas taiwanensis]|uniref:ComE operon protein 3 n=1 Tax=Tepidimonas taiwanensis TaxID=307486 RepID=A0A554WYK6_9BURK|nr:ComE operon protein 3 [Tepidimonas taiwanensis]